MNFFGHRNDYCLSYSIILGIFEIECYARLSVALLNHYRLNKPSIYHDH